MKKMFLKSILVAVIITSINCSYGDGSISDSEKYLKQKRPGSEFNLFAPGIISQAGFELHSSLAFTPDFKEVFFTKLVRKDSSSVNVILRIYYSDGEWNGPETAPFSGKYNDRSPVISPDGKKLYFSSNRPQVFGGNPGTDFDIWYLEKRDFGWSPPKYLDERLNSEFKEGQLSFSENGTVYFYRNTGRENGWGEIYKSKSINGSFTEPEKLPLPVNTDDFEAFPQIAPDESYLIYYARKGPEGTGQYICFRQEDGTWSVPKSLEKINKGALAFCTSFSPDRKYFFVLRRLNNEIIQSGENFKEGIYWTAADFIEEFRPPLNK